jgi:hypothetical protein
MQRRAGTLFLKINGAQYDVVGSYTYNLGQPKREGLVGHDQVHGFKEMPQIPFVEGEVRDYKELNLADFQNITDATVTLELANGKVIVLRNAWFAGDGNVGTEEANITVRFEGKSAEEVV